MHSLLRVSLYVSMWLEKVGSGYWFKLQKSEQERILKP